MQENDKSQKGQELLDVDDKGKIVEPKKIIKKPENKETFTHVLLIFLALVLLGLFLRIFISASVFPYPDGCGTW